MKWTTKPPREPGWYWCLSPLNAEPFIREFVRFGKIIVTALLQKNVNDIEFDGFRYAGPITPPNSDATA